MPGTRPRRAKKRTLTFAALGLAPVLLVGGVAVGGSQWIDTARISLSAGESLKLTGHGHGHGRGMGQWGAFGYAKKGWNADRILSHYYGNTTAGKVDNPDITVSLSEKKSVSVRADAGARVGGQTVAPGQAVNLSGGNASITSGCGGAVVKTVAAQWVEPIAAGPNRPADELLTFCDGDEKYRGALGITGDGVSNKLNVDDYVKGVIPKESVPAWADAGGLEALKAQAVAARSYVLAGLAAGRKMNNTQQSQVYHGVSGEDPRTNRAADATAGQVRMRGGKPALTEFSASTGGYTAGGDFPAVVDAGDSVSPNHDWTAEVSTASIASAFGVGAFRSFEVIEANGLGEGHGRVVKARIVGASRTVEATGEQLRGKLQLKSDWFAIAGQQTPPKIVKPQTGPTDPGGFLDLSPLTALLGGSVPDLAALGLDGLSGLGLGDLGAVTDQLAPMITQLISGGLPALAAKQVALDRSDNANGSMGTVSRERSDNANGSTGTVSRDESDNSQGSTGTVAKPELVTDGKGMYGLVQVLQNGLIYYSPATGAQALFGQALTDFLGGGGLAVLGFPKQDGLR